jgi:hypothetical protein
MHGSWVGHVAVSPTAQEAAQHHARGLAFLAANRQFVDAIAARVGTPGGERRPAPAHARAEAVVIARGRAGEPIRLDAIRAILRQARADIEALA